MKARSEPRLPKNGVVRIFGLDAHGQPINVEARVVDVSKHGARIGNVLCDLSVGDVIGIRYGAEKARYRIVWVGKTARVQGQIGVILVETGKYIWDLSPPRDRIADARESVVPLAGALERRPSAEEIRAAEALRAEKRFTVTGGANVREAGKNVPRWAMINDLSLGGCYLETTDPLPVETRVDVTIQVNDVRVDAKGVVTAKDPLVGMGIKFTEMTAINRDRLQHLIAMLKRSMSSSAGS